MRAVKPYIRTKSFRDGRRRIRNVSILFICLALGWGFYDKIKDYLIGSFEKKETSKTQSQTSTQKSEPLSSPPLPQTKSNKEPWASIPIPPIASAPDIPNTTTEKHTITPDKDGVEKINRGSYKSGDSSTAYNDNGNGTVTANNTGLMWQKKDDGSTRTWDTAGTYCDGLNLGGHSDWRLPTKKELMSIVDYSIPYPGPTINTTYFSNTKSSYYWSSTTYAKYPYGAWLVRFSDGFVGSYYKSHYDNYVRCVRGGQLPQKSEPLSSTPLSKTKATEEPPASTPTCVSAPEIPKKTTENHTVKTDKDAVAYINRGSAYYKKEQYDAAASDYTRAIELDPKDAVAYNKRGIAYYREGEYDAAINDITKAIKLDPKYAVAYNYRGYAYEKLEIYEQAKRDFDMYRQLKERR